MALSQKGCMYTRIYTCIQSELSFVVLFVKQACETVSAIWQILLQRERGKWSARGETREKFEFWANSVCIWTFYVRELNTIICRGVIGYILYTYICAWSYVYNKRSHDSRSKCAMWHICSLIMHLIITASPPPPPSICIVSNSPFGQRMRVPSIIMFSSTTRHRIILYATW